MTTDLINLRIKDYNDKSDIKEGTEGFSINTETK